MPDSWANALAPTPGWLTGSGWPNAYDAHRANRRAQVRSSGATSTRSATPKPLRRARMHEIRSALPDRSPIPLTQVLIQASWPASRSPSAPATELATAMPRSLWQCVSTGIPTAVASLANRSPMRARGVAADGVAVAQPVGPGLLRGQAELGQERLVGAGTVLGVHPDRARPAGPRGLHRRHHLVDQGGPVEPAAELAPQHLVAGRDGQVVVAQPQRRRPLDIAGHRPAPAGQPQVPERARLGQGELRADIGHLVEQEREPDLGLGHPEPAQIEVDHRLAELGQAEAGRSARRPGWSRRGSGCVAWRRSPGSWRPPLTWACSPR